MKGAARERSFLPPQPWRPLPRGGHGAGVSCPGQVPAHSGGNIRVLASLTSLLIVHTAPRHVPAPASPPLPASSETCLLRLIKSCRARAAAAEPAAIYASL